ncbi:Outer-membrane lipoprotein carrier protein [invertebrate metagenome]|uniref:Outer-membrane lipoprotein carrier protein n=1 Tax=invertebrate metagenome TaxID=1711999 RepID=A0A2H9TBD0_9ZZZZ
MNVMKNRLITRCLSTCFLSLYLFSLCLSPSAQAVAPSESRSGEGIRAGEAAGKNVKNDPQAFSELVKKLDAFEVFFAHFEQQSVSENGRKRVEGGEVWLKKPGQFRWQTNEPFKQVIVSQRDKTWAIDEDLMQVVIRRQEDISGNTPAQLLSGNARHFLSAYHVMQRRDGKDDVYTLVPVKDNDLFEKLEMIFTGNILKAIVLNDVLGGHRRIVFSDVKSGSSKQFPFDNNLFIARVPEDFDVIDETVGRQQKR